MFPAVVSSRSSNLDLTALVLAVSCRRRQRRGNAGALRRVLRGQWTPTANEPLQFLLSFGKEVDAQLQLWPSWKSWKSHGIC